MLAGLNLAVWNLDLLTPLVWVPIGIGLTAAVVWLLLAIQDVTEGKRWRGRAAGGLNALVSSILFLGICIVVYAFVQLWDVSWDLTREGRRDLAPQTAQVLETMSKDVTVTCFFLDVDDELLLIGRDKTLRFLEQCQKVTDLLHVEVVDPQVAVTRMEALGINFASPQGTIVLKAGNRKRVITLSGGSPRLEERDFTNALVNVLRKSEPKVLFLTGHGERDITDMQGQQGAGALAEVLKRESYVTDTLRMTVREAEVPADCDVLVVNNIGGDIHPDELAAMERFITRGGRLLLMLDPWIRVQTGSAGSEHLRPWLESRYGISVGSDIVVTDSPGSRSPLEIFLNPEQTPFTEIDEMPPSYNGCYHRDHPITNGFDQEMVWQACRSVAPAGELPDRTQVTTLVRTTPDYYGEVDTVKLYEQGSARQEPGDLEGPIPLAVAAAVTSSETDAETGQPHEGRLVVIGDSDFAANAALLNPGHLNFVMNTFAWLVESEELIAIRPTGESDPPVILTDADKRTIAWVSILFTLQVVVVAGGTVIWLRRKHQ
jgi:ABC-type uncharacterized transport system involved in gliding motility auxiliary subunit